MIQRLLLIFLLIVPCLAEAQNMQTRYTHVTDLFNSFEYSQVVDSTAMLLAEESKLDSGQVIELFRMQAISYYSQGHQGQAWNSFEQLLSINPEYHLDTVHNSPKIIKFFNEVRDKIRERQIRLQEEHEPDTAIPDTVFLMPQKVSFSKAFTRSALLPGWGHYYLGQKQKGTYFGLASAVLLTASVYLTNDTWQKERKYLNETVQSDIKQAYEKYDQSYKFRNLSLSMFSLLWLYVQYDLADSFYTFTEKTLLTVHPSGIRYSQGIALHLFYHF